MLYHVFKCQFVIFDTFHWKCYYFFQVNVTRSCRRWSRCLEPSLQAVRPMVATARSSVMAALGTAGAWNRRLEWRLTAPGLGRGRPWSIANLVSILLTLFHISIQYSLSFLSKEIRIYVADGITIYENAKGINSLHMVKCNQYECKSVKFPIRNCGDSCLGEMQMQRMILICQPSILNQTHHFQYFLFITSNRGIRHRRAFA